MEGGSGGGFSRHACVSTRHARKRRALDPAEWVALVARAKREGLLRAHRHKLRHEDLEDCLSQATIELVAQAKAGGRFASKVHVGNLLEQRFLSRVQDRRRAVGGRSSIQAALENALTLGGPGEAPLELADRRAGIEELAMLRVELRDLPRLARELTADQRLVLAGQVALQMDSAEFCRTFGWSQEKYRKVAQRARARLRRLSDREQSVPLVGSGSEKEIGTHL